MLKNHYSLLRKADNKTGFLRYLIGLGIFWPLELKITPGRDNFCILKKGLLTRLKR